jgi:Ca-activated chloride channel family protein
MTFSQPLVLLLLAVPALMLVAVPSRGWGLLLPFDHQRHRRRRLLGAALGVFDALPALLLAAVILLLAGPQTLKVPSNARELTNIQFCVDVSGSMGGGGRYDMAKDAIASFIEARAGDSFGMTLFGSHQIRWTPLTTDLSAIRSSLPFADPARQPSHMGGTRIGAALRFCRDNMIHEAERGDRMIILVSDGQSSDLGAGVAEEITDELKDAGIVVYHIHVGTDDVPEDVASIAVGTGGEGYQATDPASLARVFAHIDRMQPARFAPAGTVPMDHFRPFALIGLLLLAMHVLGLLGARYTPW